MSLNDLKSEFSYAYVRAVASAAGYFTEERARSKDADGVDLTLLSRSVLGTSVASPSLDLQVKGTAAWEDKNPFPFDLEMKNYRELRSATFQIPRILVVVVMPASPADWLVHSEEQLLVRRCGYWKALRGAPESANTNQIRILMSRQQVFDVPQLQGLMSSVANGGLP